MFDLKCLVRSKDLFYFRVFVIESRALSARMIKINSLSEMTLKMIPDWDWGKAKRATTKTRNYLVEIDQIF